jgi:hypothetical protein
MSCCVDRWKVVQLWNWWCLLSSPEKKLVPSASKPPPPLHMRLITIVDADEVMLHLLIQYLHADMKVLDTKHQSSHSQNTSRAGGDHLEMLEKHGEQKALSSFLAGDLA